MKVRVIIVAKTHLGKLACIGALRLDTHQGMRLLQPDGANQPSDTEFEIGQVWQVTCVPQQDIRPPHVEDTLVLYKELVDSEPDLASYLRRNIHPWEGPPNCTFEKLIRPTYEGSGYINEIMGVPTVSTGFWVPDHSLVLCEEAAGRLYYEYLYPPKPVRTTSKSYIVHRLKYVGYAPATNCIPAHTLVRVSLARWWRQEDADLEERCYLQLSGWYF